MGKKSFLENKVTYGFWSRKIIIKREKEIEGGHENKLLKKLRRSSNSC